MNRTSEAAIRALVDQGKSFPEVAKELGVNLNTLRGTCGLLGIKSPYNTPRTVDETAYVDGLKAGLTLAEIASKHGVTQQAIYTTLKRRGLPTCARKYLRQQAETTA